MELRSKTFLFEEETRWEAVNENVKRQIMAYDEQLMVVKVHFATGGIGDPHRHPHTQSTFVASGVFEFTVEGETQIIRTGDCVYIHPEALHGCQCLEAGILIDTFSPARRDFLSE
ncbi:cupin domain-containing protein [Parabacteroides sp. PF5-6]|uniref:cupin domain-containing protein n=1 Tax=Parabacteroides sp. PF5-6 TaxID=1742403 RepID=UPI0024070F69|nr:cupin domain-containing protein [Parabacteroides sp. PF5-6]MDF9831290.1 quercetin dioxygenase-like cupin family protein [Parabacteroides sp. PF5-6]